MKRKSLTATKSYSQPWFVRVACISPRLYLAQPNRNRQEIAARFFQAVKQGVSIVVFPELCLSGYTCADLFYQGTLLEACKAALLELTRETASLDAIGIVGLPIENRGRLYNCAALINRGKVVGLVPKTVLPNSNEFYERRWFTSGAGIKSQWIKLQSMQPTPFGTDLLFHCPTLDVTIGIELCEDLWSVSPPSAALALAGAELLANLSASNELVGKAAYRRSLVSQQSARCLAAYLYCSAGSGESSTDTVFGGHCLIYENGKLLSESPPFEKLSETLIADVDIALLRHERMLSSSFNQSADKDSFRIQDVLLERKVSFEGELLRPNSALPFIHANAKAREEASLEVFLIQVAGLERRLSHLSKHRAVVGISGGLDSTLALLVTVRAFDKLRVSRKNIYAITMPGPGTSGRTLGNAKRLMAELGVTTLCIPINDAVGQHFKDIGHDEQVHNIVYENVQARERTQLLMSIANQHDGLVIGTGDLSEAALGWCTFNGDHMSMYHVNIGLPKTLVQHVIATIAGFEEFAGIADLLTDILETPISPELLPAHCNSVIGQQTETILGPYEVHDFFLYHFVRHGSTPRKILFLAERAFSGKYQSQELVGWLRTFIRRFISQQFKRSSMPDGPKIGSVALSPRADWRMPSDVSADAWLAEIDSFADSALKKRQ